MNQIHIEQYPQLKSILWDVHVEVLDEAMVFEYYETRWRYVDDTNITKKEKQLIARLTEKYGHGIFMSA
ncbi:hypothetical protein [Neptunicella sp.]|uniref:hypothetical protein n=1 Tax=Neptunicella sp. TaxID=2125986 RepID=UPI003F690765